MTQHPYELPTRVRTTGEVDLRRALESVADQLERQKSLQIAKNVRYYLVHRNEYVNRYEGKYAKISDNGIDVADNILLGFGDFNGLVLKIGHELEYKPVLAMYCKIYAHPTQIYTMPLSFGKRSDGDKLWIANMEAVVDTGCTVTTFDESVAGWIRGSGYSYSTSMVTIDVVGGRKDVQTGCIDLDLCGTPFTGHQVNFADLNGRVALVGTDLLNSGKLDLDSGVRMSFTRH